MLHTSRPFRARLEGFISNPLATTCSSCVSILLPEGSNINPHHHNAQGWSSAVHSLPGNVFPVLPCAPLCGVGLWLQVGFGFLEHKYSQ